MDYPVFPRTDQWLTPSQLRPIHRRREAEVLPCPTVAANAS